MSPSNIGERVAELLLPELMSEEPRQWYYISVANDTFLGGYFIKAHGPTDAWTILHKLGWFPTGVDAETMTMGPVDEKEMKQVPVRQRWRKLSREDIKALDMGVK